MTSAYEQNRLNLNTTRFNDPTRVQQQLETGKNIVKELTSPENVREQLFEMAIDSSIFLFKTVFSLKFILNSDIDCVSFSYITGLLSSVIHFSVFKILPYL